MDLADRLMPEAVVCNLQRGVPKGGEFCNAAAKPVKLAFPSQNSVAKSPKNAPPRLALDKRAHFVESFTR
jgi:hypothetical protein